MREVLVFDDGVSFDDVRAWAAARGWALELELPPGELHHRALQWGVQARAVRYIEDARFGTRYIVGDDDLLVALRGAFSSVSADHVAGVLLGGGSSDEKIAALFRLTPFLFFGEVDPRWCELLDEWARGGERLEQLAVTLVLERTAREELAAARRSAIEHLPAELAQRVLLPEEG